MKFKKEKFIILVGIILLALSLTSCSSKKEKTNVKVENKTKDDSPSKKGKSKKETKKDKNTTNPVVKDQPEADLKPNNEPVEENNEFTEEFDESEIEKYKAQNELNTETKSPTYSLEIIKADLPSKLSEATVVNGVTENDREIIMDLKIETSMSLPNGGTYEDSNFMMSSEYLRASDYIFEDPYWKKLTINFENLGSISLSSDQRIKNEYGFPYFDTVLIESNIKK